MKIVEIYGQNYEVDLCRTCGTAYMAPKIVQDERRAEGGYAFCSNGHQWGWRPEGTEREKLRRERDSLKQQMARVEDEKREALAAAAKEVTAAKAEAAKIKKRALGAMCPCCNRHFSQLERHMKTQHPDVVPLHKIARVRSAQPA